MHNTGVVWISFHAYNAQETVSPQSSLLPKAQAMAAESPTYSCASATSRTSGTSARARRCANSRNGLFTAAWARCLTARFTEGASFSSERAA